MRLDAIPFGTTDWSEFARERHAGDVGEATWRTRHFGPDTNRVRVRMMECSAGYVADTGAPRAVSCCACPATCRRRLRMGGGSSWRQA